MENNLLESKIGKTLEVMGIDKNLLNGILVILEIKVRINKWDYIKLKSFCTTRKQSTREETTYRVGKILPTYFADRGLVSRIHKELKKNVPPK